MGDILWNRIAMALAVLLLATASLTLGAPVAHAATITLSPVADSYVRADQPTTNFGTATARGSFLAPRTYRFTLIFRY